MAVLLVRAVTELTGIPNYTTSETKMKIRISAIGILASTLTLIAPVSAAESIVGTWDNEDCSRPMVIGQLSMQANDTICRFDTVKRRGNEVTWKGDCNGEDSTVVATLSGGRLTVDMGGVGFFDNLKRCDKKGGGGGEQASGIPSFLKKGGRYNEALRQKLFNAGWDTQGPGDEERDCDASSDDRCDFPEVASCSGSGAAFCNMVWIKDGRTITITTSGEEASSLRISRVRKGAP
jgi:hypothetical protein